jgi:hypothetical protein
MIAIRNHMQHRISHYMRALACPPRNEEEISVMPNPTTLPAKARKAATKAKPVTGAKPTGMRAQIEADARAGKVPAAPDFSAETHKRFRGKLDDLKAMVAARDIEGLRRYALNPVSSSPRALDRYRNLAILALEAMKTD